MKEKNWSPISDIRVRIQPTTYSSSVISHAESPKTARDALRKCGVSLCTFRQNRLFHLGLVFRVLELRREVLENGLVLVFELKILVALGTLVYQISGLPVKGPYLRHTLRTMLQKETENIQFPTVCGVMYRRATIFVGLVDERSVLEQ